VKLKVEIKMSFKQRLCKNTLTDTVYTKDCDHYTYIFIKCKQVWCDRFKLELKYFRCWCELWRKPKRRREYSCNRRRIVKVKSAVVESIYKPNSAFLSATIIASQIINKLSSSNKSSSTRLWWVDFTSHHNISMLFR